MTAHALALLLGTVLDRLFGDPDAIWRRWPHPVVWMGRAVAALDAALNRPALSHEKRRRAGIVTVVLLVGGSALAGMLLEAVFALFGPLAILLRGTVLAVFLAQKSLIDHVAAVADALRTGGLPAGRAAVAMIVGRDPETLDASGIADAAIESLAENASDGVVAPWLFFLFLGLPGLLAYKMANTADSMIGHRGERYRAFGWAAARLDDGLNWPAARLTAALFALEAGLRGGWGSAWAIWAVARRDAPHHRSPNAGWPEAALGASLGVALGGPRRYGAETVDGAYMNADGRRAIGVGDIDGALGRFRAAMIGLAMIAALLVLLG